MTNGNRLVWGWVVVVGVAGCSQAEAPQTRSTHSPTPGSSPEVAQGSSEKAGPRVRPAAVAGLFYPADKESLGKQIDALLAEAKPAAIQRLRGLIAPHAGYRYSGPTAAAAYKQLARREIRTVVVMAPSHYAAFEGTFISDRDAYETPLGRIAVAPLTRELARNRPFVTRPRCLVDRPSWAAESPREPPAPGEDLPDTWEHSLEVQLPFLQKTLSDFSIVPIVFGQADPEAVARELGKHLDDKTLLVASSDLSHYVPDTRARDLDSTCIEAICRLNCEWMAGQDACGKGPILSLMHLAVAKGWKAKRLDYRTSGDTAGDRSAVVGYAAIAFVEEDGKPDPSVPPDGAWTPDEKKMLLALARRTIGEAVRKGEIAEMDLSGRAPKLTGPRACFVTLTQKGQLRGCIGHIFPREPLLQAVAHNAASAALRDPRFPPLSPQELERTDIEISILTLPERLQFKSPEELLGRLRPGVDGVVLRVGQQQATYLPQVWEQLPDKQAFMSHLAEKAGLGPSEWKRPEAVVLVYQVEKFEEKEPAKQERASEEE